MTEFRESDVPSVKFDDLELRERSRCWSSRQACSVEIVDREGMKALARRLNKDSFAQALYEKVIDPELASMSATILCKDYDLARLQRDYEPRFARSENQMLTAWNIKALPVQVDMVLVFFGLNNKDMNCSNVGEPADAVKRRLWFCGQFFRILMQDSGLLAIVPRSDALIFLIWLAFAIPLSLVDHMIPAEGEVNQDTDEFVFKTKFIMLLVEFMKVMNNKERAALASCGRDERNRKFALAST